MDAIVYSAVIASLVLTVTWMMLLLRSLWKEELPWRGRYGKFFMCLWTLSMVLMLYGILEMT